MCFRSTVKEILEACSESIDSCAWQFFLCLRKQRLEVQAADLNIMNLVNMSIYGANHLETMTFVQTQNHLEAKKCIYILYLGINMGTKGKDFGVIWPCRATQKNCTCSIQHFGHQIGWKTGEMNWFVSHTQIWDGLRKKTPSILSLNLIPLGDLSSSSKGVFSQEKINLGFFLNFA